MPGYHITLTPLPAHNEQIAPTRHFDLYDGEVLTVSRLSKRLINNGRQQKILFDCPVISRNHAEICSKPASLTITDLGSTHGTWVNGKKLVTREPHDLLQGDRLEFGTTITNGAETHNHVRVNINFTPREQHQFQIDKDSTQRFGQSFRPYDSADEEDERESAARRDFDEESLDDAQDSSMPTSPSDPTAGVSPAEPAPRILYESDVLYAPTHRFDPRTQQFTYADSTVETTQPGTKDHADHDLDSTFRCRPTGLPDGPLPIKLSGEAARSVIKSSGMDKLTRVTQGHVLDINERLVAEGECSEEDLSARLREDVGIEMMCTVSMLDDGPYAPDGTPLPVDRDYPEEALQPEEESRGRKRKLDETEIAAEAGDEEHDAGKEKDGVRLPLAKRSRAQATPEVELGAMGMTAGQPAPKTMAVLGGQPGAMAIGAVAGVVFTVLGLAYA